MIQLMYFINIIEAFIAIENESMKIKEDPVDNFIDVKDEELSTLPIADVSHLWLFLINCKIIF